MNPRLWNHFDVASPSTLAELENVLQAFNGRAVEETARPTSHAAPIDVNELEDRFECYLDLPGIAKEDLKISLEDSTLVVHGERPAQAVTEQTSKLFRRTERWTGAFSRTLTLPSSVDGLRVEAQLKDGVLKLVLPKREQAKARTIQIN